MHTWHHESFLSLSFFGTMLWKMRFGLVGCTVHENWRVCGSQVVKREREFSKLGRNLDISLVHVVVSFGVFVL